MSEVWDKYISYEPFLVSSAGLYLLDALLNSKSTCNSCHLKIKN